MLHCIPLMFWGQLQDVWVVLLSSLHSRNEAMTGWICQLSFSHMDCYPPKNHFLHCGSWPLTALISQNNIHYFFMANPVNTEVLLYPSVSPILWVLRCEGHMTLSILRMQECSLSSTHSKACQSFVVWSKWSPQAPEQFPPSFFDMLNTKWNSRHVQF